jgi:hypothetical protein
MNPFIAYGYIFHLFAHQTTTQRRNEQGFQDNDNLIVHPNLQNPTLICNSL